MISSDYQGGDSGLGYPLQFAYDFQNVAGVRVDLCEEVTGYQEDIHLLGNREVGDALEGIQEIYASCIQTGLRIDFLIVCLTNVVVSGMQNSHPSQP